MAMGPAAPPLPTLPSGCSHRWQEQEELREVQALPSSVATDSSEATRSLCWPLVLKSLRKPWFCQFLGHCKRVSLLTWGLYAVPLQETWPVPPHWLSPHDSFFYGPLFLVVPTPRLLMFIHSETSSPTNPSIVSHACPPLPSSLTWPLYSIHFPKC